MVVDHAKSGLATFLGYLTIASSFRCPYLILEVMHVVVQLGAFMFVNHVV